MKIKMNIELSRCVDGITVCKIGLQKQIRDILGLFQIVSIRRRINLKTKKMAKSAKILHLKMLTEKLFELQNTDGTISNDNHIINI
jgi:hypothetical protein